MLMCVFFKLVNHLPVESTRRSEKTATSQINNSIRGFAVFNSFANLSAVIVDVASQ